MAKKITRESIGKELFELIIDDMTEEAFQDHRRGSNFYTSWIFEVDQDLAPDNPELWGYWQSNTFVWDAEWGYEKSDITELTKVVKRTKVIETHEWVEASE